MENYLDNFESDIGYIQQSTHTLKKNAMKICEGHPRANIVHVLDLHVGLRFIGRFPSRGKTLEIPTAS